jgi:hypothetical protein
MATLDTRLLPLIEVLTTANADWLPVDSRLHHAEVTHFRRFHTLEQDIHGNRNRSDDSDGKLAQPFRKVIVLILLSLACTINDCDLVELRRPHLAPLKDRRFPPYLYFSGAVRILVTLEAGRLLRLQVKRLGTRLIEGDLLDCFLYLPCQVLCQCWNYAR